MNTLPINEFIQAVVYDHSIATGLKALRLTRILLIMQLPRDLFFHQVNGSYIFLWIVRL